MRQYLKDLEPEEVIDRLNNGERVYYEDSRGNKYSYKVYKGMTIRYNEDGEVDGYNRSIYSTGEAYFTDTKTIEVKLQHHYRTKDGMIVYIEKKEGCWYHGKAFRDSNVYSMSWLKDGRYYEGDTSPRDIIEEIE